MYLIKYVLIQCLGAGLDFVLFLVLISETNTGPIVSNFISKVFGSAVAFFGHRYFSFSEQGTGETRKPVLRQAAKYTIALPASIATSSCFLLLFIELGIAIELAKVSTDAITFSIFYLVSRHIIFK